MRIVASYNVKGGVGKTTAAVNLAYLSAREGRRTLLWDLDPQGAATFLFRVKPRVKGGGGRLVRRERPIGAALKATDFTGLDLLPADVTYRNLDLDLAGAHGRSTKASRALGRLLGELADDYDVVFLDTPPSLSLVSENALRASDVVLVPIIPTVLALRTYDQLAEFVDGFDGRRPRLHAFFSMADRRKSLHREIIASLPGERDGISPTAVPALSQVEQMAVHRAPLPVYAPDSPATRAYHSLWTELAGLAGA
ncbi:ParA family protein [Prauserella muralis]|uniref:Cobyrinic acid a,c-diamide synthase n=1 Tax=Prauserella muralis TaxID=588067 RepID=A0A2V4AKI8_9PSEU|nr:AAA family ATPase [Prauserella muralis]PXY20808.1 cobyrinic acid a,c-diamide synthase [Prauserella muralis]TWE29836.1 cellulose biosynthesis protein BcsQ [Prauserella muralis]